MDEGANVGERAEGQPFDDFGRESIFELSEAVEQVNAVIFKVGKDAGARIGRQDKIFEMAFERARVEELARRFEEPIIIEYGIVNDKIRHIWTAPIFVGVNDSPVCEKCPIGIFELEGNHAGRIST